jgi:hypothetical protein
MTIIAKVLQREEFRQRPPVLMDVGASETLHAQWKSIARYSVCIAFDADQREFGHVTDDSGAFRKLYIFKSILSDTASDSCTFYLTRSPYCSSTLKPNTKALAPWSFAPKFEVVETVTLRSTTLPDVLREVDIDYVDWFKTDTQGTDLRLFRSMNESMMRSVLAADFEPGIIDSYDGEDKLHQLLSFMDTQPFWMAQMIVKGSQRLSSGDVADLSSSPLMQKLHHFSLSTSPGWAEVSYLNTFDGPLSIREHLLGWVFATIQGQHGFAMVLARQGQVKYEDPLFLEMRASSVRSLRTNMLRLKFMPAVVEKITKLFHH